MGPFFGNRQAANEIGQPIYNDAYKTFYGGFVDDELVGILSVNHTRLISVITDCYIRPAWRGNGYLHTMLKAILQDAHAYQANCNINSLASFTKNGFNVVSNSKNYTKVIRHAKN